MKQNNRQHFFFFLNHFIHKQNKFIQTNEIQLKEDLIISEIPPQDKLLLYPKRDPQLLDTSYHFPQVAATHQSPIHMQNNH